MAFLKALTDTSLQPDPPARVPSGLPVVEVKTKAKPAPQSAVAMRHAVAPASGGGSGPLIGYSSGNMQRVPGVALARRWAGRRRGGTPAPRPASPRIVAGATFTVLPGQSIQAAIDRCRSGDRVEVEPGVYNQSVVVKTSGITLAGAARGDARPILDGQGTLASAVQVAAEDLVIEGFTIRHYKQTGVATEKNSRVLYRDVIVESVGSQ